jgi:hypothetical protein
MDIRTEETPTLTDDGFLWGQHDGPVGTKHRFRWVYGDRTPVVGERGHWVACTDCDES